MDSGCGGVPYLAIIQNKTETSGNRLERTKGIRRFLDRTKDKFCPRRCERLDVQFVVIYRTRLWGTWIGACFAIGNRLMTIGSEKAVWVM